MKKLNELWSTNKKTILLYSSISFIVLMLIIIVIIILFNLFRKYEPPRIEKIMVDATKSYIKKNPNYSPTIENPEEIMDVSTLVNEKYMKSLDKLSKTKGCTGTIKIIYNEGSLRYEPKLECNDYTTSSLSDTILNRGDIVTENNGLYELNDFYTYRGEYVNNYVNFVNYSWRIIKFNEDIMYLILSDTIDGKTSYVFDDRYNESTDAYRGKSEYTTSRINTSLMDIYNSYFLNYHAYLKVMPACIHTRSELDTDKAGNIECYTTYDTPISLLPVYDYMNASIDNACTRSTSRNCSNYNYLAKVTNRWWLMNGTNTNTYEVYNANTSGALSLDAANSKKYLRPVIAIPSTVIYKTGNGTSTHPYEFHIY